MNPGNGLIQKQVNAASMIHLKTGKMYPPPQNEMKYIYASQLISFFRNYLYAAISMSRAIFTFRRSWYSFRYRAISLFVVLSSFSNLLTVSC